MKHDGSRIEFIRIAMGGVGTEAMALHGSGKGPHGEGSHGCQFSRRGRGGSTGREAAKPEWIQG